MKKNLLFISVIVALCLSGCNNINSSENEHNSSSSESQITSRASYEESTVNESNVNTGDTANSENISQEIENVSRNSLPENVVISIWGHTLSDNDITEINFSENGVWSLAKYEGFVYLLDPAENGFKKYIVGDEICGLKLTSAHNIFSNDYLDNEYHEEYRCTSIAELEGTLTMTGTLTIAADDEANLMAKKGDIIFSPKESVFPIISGLPENTYYVILCGNINDNVIPELLQLPLGEEVDANITVSDITLYSAMPVDTSVRCKIDSIDLL